MRPSETVLAELAAGLGVAPRSAAALVAGFLQGTRDLYGADMSTGDMLSELADIAPRLEAGAALSDRQALVRTIMEWLGTQRDAIRLGELDLGPPLIYLKATAPPGITGGASTTLTVPVPKSGEVDFFVAQVGRIGNADAVPSGFVSQISIGADVYFTNLGNQPDVFNVAPPYFQRGFLRRIRVKQNSNWTITLETLGAAVDTYTVTFAASQYFTPVPSL